MFPIEADTQTPIQRFRRTAGAVGSAVAQRFGLFRGSSPDNAHTPSMKLFYAEMGAVAEPVLRRFRPQLPIELSTQPRVVILLPGFGTGPTRMRYMAQQLERAGHTVKRWGLGHNLGPTDETLGLLSDRICEVSERYGQKVVLVGWSLGGVFAREVAKMKPECVAKVVTMGSPFSHTPYSNNLWRAYQVVAGHSVENPPIPSDLHTKPPVETIAFWSPRDGVISRRAACGASQERDRAVALRCTHLTFPTSPDCIMAVINELEACGNCKTG